MKKRLFAIMLALAMLLAAVPALAEEGDGEPNKTAEKVEKQETEQGVATRNSTSIEQNEQQQSNEAQLKSQPVKAPASPVGTGDNTEESSNTDSTGNSDSTDGNTGTNGGQNPHTSDGEGGGDQETCEHHTWTYEDAPRESTYYCHKHKKTCSKCKKIEVWEDHAWNRANQEMVEESTCTKQGKDKLTCTLCKHVTYALRELKPHTKDNGKVIKPATCTEKGKIKYTCTECKSELPEEEIPALGHDYEYLWGTWDCKTKTITACRKCKRAECTVMENPTAISFSEKGRDTCYSCGKKYTTVYYEVVAKYGNENVKYEGKAECTYSTSDYCRPDWYYAPCYYNNPCGHWGCGNVCTRYSNCVPCRDYRTTFRVGGYNCLATPKTGDASVIAPAMLALIGAAGAMLGKKRR